MTTECTESSSLRDLTNLNTVDYETFTFSDYVAFPQTWLSFILKILTLLKLLRVHVKTCYTAPSKGDQSNFIKVYILEELTSYKFYCQENSKSHQTQRTTHFISCEIVLNKTYKFPLLKPETKSTSDCQGKTVSREIITLMNFKDLGFQLVLFSFL